MQPTCRCGSFLKTLWPAALTALLVGGACSCLLWQTMPLRPRGELALPGMSTWWHLPDPNTIATLSPAVGKNDELQTIHIWDLTSGKIKASFPVPWLQRVQ